MATVNYTSLLGLALPTTGDLSGTWGSEVNEYLSKYVDSAVEGTQTISGSQTAVTLSVTNGTALSQAAAGATGSAQFAIINCTGNPGGLLTITVPASSRQYIVLNSTSTNQSVKIVGAGPTTGVTLVASERAIVAWNGSDFVKVASSAADGVTTIDFGTTGLTPNTATSGAVTVAGTLAVANGGTGQTAYTNGQLLIGNTATGGLTKAALTQGSGVTITNGNGSITISATGSGGDAVLSANNAFTGANTFYNGTGQTFGTATAAQDGIILAGRAGGTSTYRVTLTRATLSSSTTLTLPNVTSTLAALGATQTFTATQTFSGSSSALAMVLNDAAEVATISATAANGTINYDVTTQSVLYYTTNASGNFTVNFRASSGTSLNTAMSTGQSVTVVFLVTNGGTAYYNSAVQVDGGAITPKWQGGAAPTSGNASSVDVYSYTIFKTGSAAFTVFASQTKFA